MDARIRANLDRVIGGYEQDVQAAARLEAEHKTQDESFVTRFRRIRATVIRPVLEEVGREVKSRGHDYQIVEDDDQIEGWGHRKTLKIDMGVFPNGFPKPVGQRVAGPGISFAAHASNQRVCVCVNTMLMYGGECLPKLILSLDEVTRESVEREVLNAVTSVFDQARASAHPKAPVSD